MTMANGDKAAAAGMDVVPGNGHDLRMGYDEINKSRDYLADHMTDGTHDASAITTGTFDVDRIPDLPVSKITGGTQANGPTSTAYNRSATGSSWRGVWMNEQLQFMYNSSTRRHKDDVEPAELDVEAFLALQPVTYHRKGQPEGTRELGLIAEDAVDVAHLVGWDFDRDPDTNEPTSSERVPQTVRYDQVAVVYLLEVCRQQQAAIDELTRRVDELTKGD